MGKMKMLVRSLLIAMFAVTALGLTARGADKKVLFVDSYHEGYAWSDGITAGVKKVIGDQAELKIHRMDTKRNASDEFKKQAAEKAKKLIEEWQPDVVIASDDNASKFLIKPYYAGKDLPFVFCGVNWDAGVYGFPTDNVCGMEEVSLVKPLLAQMKKYAKGDKIGFIGPDIETAKKEEKNVEEKFGLELNSFYAKDFAGWKSGFKKLQDECDMLIVASDGGLYEDQAAEMKAFVLENTKIPSGACYDFMAPYTLFAYSKVAQEQGEWAAAAAIRILEGESPEEVGVTQNKRGELYVNLPIARALGADIPLAVLKRATVIKE
jgi:ABC-type uncharacterized transport system substrate-binding protein